MSEQAVAPQAEMQVSESQIEQSASEELESSDEQQAPEVKAEVKRTNKLKLKIDGQEFEETLPFDLPDDPKAIEYLQKQLQMSKASTKRFEEAAQLRKQVDEIGEYLSQAKGNPKALRKLIKELDGDEKEIARMIVEEELEIQSKTPEQLEREKLEAKLRELEDEKKEREKSVEEERRKMLEERAFERYDKGIDRALQSSDLPKSPYVVKKIAEYLALGIQNGLDPEPEDVLPLVREEIMEDIKSMFGAMPEEIIESIIGKDTIKKIRKKDIEKAKAAKSVPSAAKLVPDTGGKPSESQKSDAKKSYKDFFGF